MPASKSGCLLNWIYFIHDYAIILILVFTKSKVKSLSQPYTMHARSLVKITDYQLGLGPEPESGQNVEPEFELRQVFLVRFVHFEPLYLNRTLTYLFRFGFTGFSVFGKQKGHIHDLWPDTVSLGSNRL